MPVRVPAGAGGPLRGSGAAAPGGALCAIDASARPRFWRTCGPRILRRQSERPWLRLTVVPTLIDCCPGQPGSRLCRSAEGSRTQSRTPRGDPAKAPGGQGGRLLSSVPLLIPVRQVGWVRRSWAAVGPDAGMPKRPAGSVGPRGGSRGPRPDELGGPRWPRWRTSRGSDRG